ncbi:MAG: glucosaminidase domain-containing protein [Actinomycetota bacterium]
MVCLIIIPRTAFAADGYTVNSNLRHNPGVSAAQLDGYVRSVYPSSPLVGLGSAWINAGARYNIDPVYLMAHAILESGWGFSWISDNKYNLYGWGAYDRDPGGMAWAYSSYDAGINDIAANISAMYLTQTGEYYTPFGPTLRGMNVHYATSKTWADSIAEIMNEFAGGVSAYRYPPPYREYDAAYSRVDVPSVMQPGTSQTAIIKVANGGDAAWQPGDEFKLQFQLIDFAGRIAQIFYVDVPVEIKSGQSALISIPVSAPAAVGLYTMRFDMSRGGAVFYSQAGISPLSSGLTIVPKSLYYQAEVRGLSLPDTVYAGTMFKPTVEVTNTSESTWPDSVTSFGYQWIDLTTGQAAGTSASAGTIPGRVFPGQTVQVPLEIRTPEKPGRYLFKASPVDSGTTWFLSNGSPGYSAIVDVSPEYGASYRVIGDIEPLLAATPKTIYVTVTNASRMTWVAGGAVKLSYSFSDSGDHEGYSAPERLSQDVRPGESVTLPVELTPPPTGGPYSLSLDLSYRDQGWFSDFGVPVFRQNVSVGYDLRVAYEEAETGSVTVGHYTSVRLKVTNTSKMVWPAGGRLKAAYRIGFQPGRAGYIVAAPLKSSVKPEESAVLEFTISDPPEAGIYYLSFDLYLDGAGWFSVNGNPTPSRLIIVD